MVMRSFLCLVFAAVLPAAELAPLPSFAKPASGLQILAPCSPRMPWTVAGERGAMFGRQNGKFEAWLWPVKILSNFSIRAELADYAVPIDVNALAAEIKVTPAETIITYSHAAFTIRQHAFAARGSDAPAAGTAAFFEINAARPLDVTFSFTPEMLRMWPAPNFGRPSGEWVAQGNAGVYVLHTDDPKFSAVVAMPRAKPGIQVPYQEHPQTYPLEFKLSFDPKRDGGTVFPLVMAITDGKAPIEQAAQMNAGLPSLYGKTQDYYNHFFARRLTIETPNRRLNEALQWAEIAIDQTQVKYHGETGMVAGYYESADSARPGYAWFFGRDTLWTTYAINSYGDFALTRRALDFLIKRQRADGKIMHEFSQSADALDWQSTPYFYASADSTPLLIMALWDYVKTSGDIAYLKANGGAARKAYSFMRAHQSSDGIYNNSEGTGWVESWPQGMPYQEIYLAALDQQAAEAMAHLADALGDSRLADSAHKEASSLREKIEAKYFDGAKQFYAFSLGKDGSKDNTASIYPAVAWWDGTLALQQAGPMLTRWASSEFSTDWGTRDISNKTPFYDPISYHQGSIWPLFTGWVSLAEYRAGRPLSGYAHLMQNVNLTWAQDLGSVTELLSGDFYQPLGRSSSHQMWSSAMIISPLVRGLFGLDWDAPHHTLRVAPQLPAEWEGATLKNVPLGGSFVDITYQRQGGKLLAQATTRGSETICLQGPTGRETPCNSAAAGTRGLRLPLPPVELFLPAIAPEQGAKTAQLKVLNEEWGARQGKIAFEGLGNTSFDLPIRLNRPHISAEGAEIHGGKIHLQLPDGNRYQGKTVTFTW